MKIIVSDIVQKKISKDDEKLEDYFQLLYPPDYAEDMVSEEQGSIKVARKISVPLKGKLCRKDNHFVYVDISNDVIHGLFRLIDDPEAEKPPYFGEGKAGAHISVMHEKEWPGDEFEKEIGKEFTFKLRDFYSVEPETWDGVKRVWFVEVYSPELKRLRRKYGLPGSYMGRGHEFHITIAIETDKDKVVTV